MKTKRPPLSTIPKPVVDDSQALCQRVRKTKNSPIHLAHVSTKYDTHNRPTKHAQQAHETHATDMNLEDLYSYGSIFH